MLHKVLVRALLAAACVETAAAQPSLSPGTLNDDDVCQKGGDAACALNKLQRGAAAARQARAASEGAEVLARYQAEQQELLARQRAEAREVQQAAEAAAANGTGAALSAQWPTCKACKCYRQNCCPRSATDCITDACQVAEIYYYLVEQGHGSACTEYVQNLPSFAGGGETVGPKDLCVSSNLVSSVQAFVKGDPGRCRHQLYGPGALAPQLGCSQWAWFSSADSIVNFLQFIYGQSSFDPATLVQSLLDAVGAGVNPASTATSPITWAKVTLFDRTKPYAPPLAHPGPQALLEGPKSVPVFSDAPGKFVYAADREAPEPPVPSAKRTAGSPYWWLGNNFQLTECSLSLCQTPAALASCENSKRVLTNLNLAAQQDLLTKNLAQITGCPWTPGARAPNGREKRGPQPGDPFNFFDQTGLYGCAGTFAEQASCMTCPADAACLLPDADAVKAGFHGCGQTTARTCYPVGWFGIKNGNSFPTDGCKQEWVDDLHAWLADPYHHLEELSQKGPGTVTAIEAYNTLMFTRDLLFTSGHTGWISFGGAVHADADGNPTCSINGADGYTDGEWSPGTKCGTGANLPCCDPTETDPENNLYVGLAPDGGPNYEWVTANGPPNPCLTTIHICGPAGEGPKTGPFPWSPSLACSA